MIYSVILTILINTSFFEKTVIGCLTKTIHLVESKTYTINSNETDFDKNICEYTFIPPQYFIPHVFGLTNFGGSDSITIQQISPFGGPYNYKFSGQSTILQELEPTNLTVIFPLSNTLQNGSFIVAIYLTNATPVENNTELTVSSDLGLILNTFPVNSSISQIQSSQNYFINVFVDSQDSITQMKHVHIYESDVYKGSIYDVYVAQSQFQRCECTKCSIVKLYDSLITGFSIIMQQNGDWSSASMIFLNSSYSNFTQTLSATNGLRVFQESTPSYLFPINPYIIKNITFRGEGVLEIYAGCVTSRRENLRIATIDPYNVAEYSQLILYGQCRTYVLSQGIVDFTVIRQVIPTCQADIGTKGVIASYFFPYLSSDHYFQNYLIQSKDISQYIDVNYEIIAIGKNINVTINRYIQPNNTTTFTSSDVSKNISVRSSYQQLIQFTVPSASDGVFMRYTVKKSSYLEYFVSIIISTFYYIY